MTYMILILVASESTTRYLEDTMTLIVLVALTSVAIIREAMATDIL
jgi:hypothetical protein